jgi:hypothetical protein
MTNQTPSPSSQHATQSCAHVTCRRETSTAASSWGSFFSWGECGAFLCALCLYCVVLCCLYVLSCVVFSCLVLSCLDLPSVVFFLCCCALLCLVLSSLVLSWERACLVSSCRVLRCVWSCCLVLLALSCHVMSCLVLVLPWLVYLLLLRSPPLEEDKTNTRACRVDLLSVFLPVSMHNPDVLSCSGSQKC